jgi:hypothetical protein
MRNTKKYGRAIQHMELSMFAAEVSDYPSGQGCRGSTSTSEFWGLSTALSSVRYMMLFIATKFDLFVVVLT